MVRAWYMDDSDEDQRLEHHTNPPRFLDLDTLNQDTGVEYFKNTIRWEKSGNTVLLISCPSLYPHHSRLSTSNSAGLAAFEDGASYRCYRQMRNSELSEDRMEIHDENRSGRPSVSDGVVGKVETIFLEDQPSPLQPRPSPNTDDEVKEEVTRFLKGLAAEFYNMGIEKLEHRLQKYLDINGVYVEK
ncbi:1,2-dihydroxy-3-keto-5-methylthiopentene dioxygenase [Homalodisca vitripennis]|nr:1,2-dihydroxy-3-keto-5-methylthiopentene dioxygenase [Homalodisca vitripennis]